MKDGNNSLRNLKERLRVLYNGVSKVEEFYKVSVSSAISVRSRKFSGNEIDLKLIGNADDVRKAVREAGEKHLGKLQAFLDEISKTPMKDAFEQFYPIFNGDECKTKEDDEEEELEY